MKSQFEPFTFRELNSLEDSLLLPWLDLYESAFPQNERLPVSAVLSILLQKQRGEKNPAHCLAALDSSGRLLGIAIYFHKSNAPVLVLWYLAVMPDLRSAGIGSRIYRYIEQRARADCKAIVFDVEIPERANDEAERSQRERRISFYRQLGARMLGGVYYAICANPGYEPVPMHLMVHPLHPLGAPEAFDLANRVVDGDVLSRVGELALM